MSKTVQIMEHLSLEVDKPMLISILGVASSGKNQAQYKFITDYSKQNLPTLFIPLEVRKETAIRQITRKLNVYDVKSNQNIFVHGGSFPYEGLNTTRILDLCTANDFKAIFIESSRFLNGDIGMYNSNKRVLLLEKSGNELKESKKMDRISQKMNKVYEDLRIISQKTNTHVFVAESINRRTLEGGNPISMGNSRLILTSDIVLTSKNNMETIEASHDITIEKNRYGIDGFNLVQNFII
jgi:hypothetical protein